MKKEIKLWNIYTNSWDDVYLIASITADGFYMGYKYGNHFCYLFNKQGKYCGCIDDCGRNMSPRNDTWNLKKRVGECQW